MDYLRELQDCRGGSMLEELDALNVEVTYRRALESSVAYMAFSACRSLHTAGGF